MCELGAQSVGMALCAPDHRLNLLFVLGVNLVAVFGPHQHGCKAESRVLQACPVTLNHSGRQDGHDVCKTARADSSSVTPLWAT